MDQLLYGFDTALYSFFWKFQNPMTIGLAEICQRMGDKTAYIICLVVALILCVPKVTRKYGVAMVVGFLVAYLVVNVIIKPGVGRPRPYVTLQQTPFWETYEPHWKNAGSPLEDDDSFPSGHTSLNFTIFTALTALLLKEKKKWAWLLMIIPFVVGFTRIIRCVHYPSDVVGGMIFGIAAGLIGNCSRRSSKRSIQIRIQIQSRIRTAATKGMRKKRPSGMEGRPESGTGFEASAPESRGPGNRLPYLCLNGPVFF